MNSKISLLALCLLMVGVSSPAISGADDIFYPLRTDWSQSRGQTNFSVFVFNDLNGNGSYDLGDRAMAGVATGLSQNGAPLHIAKSNISGFSNFPASVSRENAHIPDVGEYDFEVFVPPGWRVSTGNKVQRIEIVRVEGSNSGLGMAEVLQPVGLERYKFIRGTFGLPEAANLSLMQGGALIAQATLSLDEPFLWPVEPGEYELVSGEFSRPVRVGAYPVDIGRFSAVPTTALSGRVINFENMAPSGLQKTPNGYGGLNWFNLNIMASADTAGDVGYVNGAISGFNILYNSSGHPGLIYANSGFDFIEINLTGAWPEAEGEELLFSFFSGEALVMQDHVGLSSYGPITYQPLLGGITRIELATAHNWQVVIDDIVVNTSP